MQPCWRLLTNDHLYTIIPVAASDDSEAESNPVEEFGHFVKATLLQETQLLIIATLRGKVIRNRDETMSQR